jgi:oligopeptide/dipeptide ABC transporter ATP-binding protein
MALLEVEDLHTHIFTRAGVNRAVNGVSFKLDAGQTLGLVGESGSGKTMTAMSILRLIPKPAAQIVSGRIMFDGEDLNDKSESEMRQVRGAEIAIILQDPLSSLNPVFNIKFQIGEAIALHQHLSGALLSGKVIESLGHVRVSAPEERMKNYPHQFSGGMRQRVVGAIAISCEPRLLIADEPTTALDATIQAQYLNLLRDLQQQFGLALLFITHDFGIVAKMCDEVAVMYAGRMVEHASVRPIFDTPAHPYTLALLQAVPKMDSKVERLFAIEGVPATGHTEFKGCSFASRCPVALDKCHVEPPPLVLVAADHFSECWRAEEVFAKGNDVEPTAHPGIQGSSSQPSGD